jgi:hypothetical protein
MKNIAILAVIFGAFVFTTSCKKIEEPTAVNVIESAGTATISGIAYADLDDTDPEDEFAPSGTKLLITVNQNQFPGATTYANNGNKLMYTATVGAQGAWSVTVKAPKTAITAVVWPQDFREDYKDANDDTQSAEFYYDGASFNVTVVDGSAPIQDFKYDRN